MTTTASSEPTTTKTALSYLRVSTAEQAHSAGSTEGYSIPAQREACQRKASELGAEVIAVFADPGASARSADRPQLQALLAHLAEQGGVDYVIVHKIDRLARNRADDVEIQIAIERAGAQLVSVTESVDKTPSGKLVRNIMADLAEFYSANLATEILKGSTEKARRGGTPGLAPIGYLNVRKVVDGHEVRTVILDEERAPFVHRAFELYASGEYSVRQLHRTLTDEGFTTRATAKRTAQALALSKLHTLLRNRYYIGQVTYRGIENPGLHQAIMSAELFAKVQRILDERDQTSTKQRTHSHYLRGLLTCARCGSRLIYMQVNGRGGRFSYYACGRRHRLQTCDLPYLTAEDIERRLEQAWPLTVNLNQLDADEVAQQLGAEIAGDEQQRITKITRTQARLAKLDKESRKLLELAYADAIPLDLLRSEQQRVAREQLTARADQASDEATSAQIASAFQQAVDLMHRGAAIYAVAGDEARRELIRAFLAHIRIDADDCDLELGSPWREIARTAHYLRETSPRPTSHGRNPVHIGHQTKNPRRISAVRGSKINLLVELRVSGFTRSLTAESGDC
jgi:site-specific DNA recombinase